MEPLALVGLLGVRLFLPFPIDRYTRYTRQPNKIGVAAHRVDFSKPEVFHPAGDLNTPSVWISFGPIWLFAPFFEQLALRYPERLAHLSGLITSSSSSAITKRFASNPFDREWLPVLPAQRICCSLFATA